MDINNKLRIHWACRRGMKELDLLVMPFFEHEYDNLSAEDKLAFVALLDYQDPQLFSWFMNRTQPEYPNIQRIIHLIQERNRKHGPSAL